MEIEFYDITLRGEVAEAEYYIVDETGTANVQQQIKRKTLLDFIVNQGLNKESGVTHNPENYLEDNHGEVIQLYVTENAN